AANVTYGLTDTSLTGTNMGTDTMVGIGVAQLTAGPSATFNVSHWSGQADLFGLGTGDTFNVHFQGSGAGQTLIENTGNKGQAFVYGTNAATMTVTSTKVTMGSEGVAYAASGYDGLNQLTVNGNGGTQEIDVQSTNSATT